MTSVVRNDFIRLDYTAHEQETGKVFDTTLLEKAQQAGISVEGKTFAPVAICVGQREVIPGLDEDLVGKQVDKSFTVIIIPEKGFGIKRPDLVQTMSTSLLTKQQIRPYPGLHVFGQQGLMGIVRSTFLIDQEQIIRHEWINVDAKGHAKEVLETLRKYHF